MYYLCIWQVLLARKVKTCYDDIVVIREVNGMNEIMNLLLAVVKTGDDANMGKWIVIMVVVGILLVVLAVMSVISSKKKKEEAGKAEEKSADKE